MVCVCLCEMICGCMHICIGSSAYLSVFTCVHACVRSYLTRNASLSGENLINYSREKQLVDKTSSRTKPDIWEKTGVITERRRTLGSLRSLGFF